MGNGAVCVALFLARMNRPDREEECDQDCPPARDDEVDADCRRTWPS